MLIRILFAALALAAAGAAPALGQATAPLDDASSLRPAVDTAQAGADAIDDAAADAGGELAGVQTTAGPLAFGVVTANGTKFSGTPNFTSSYNSSLNRYEIAIAGTDYYYLAFTTAITPAGDPVFCHSSSVGGRLLVMCNNASGQPQAARFGFITFRQ
jgi:hypothetical protein